MQSTVDSQMYTNALVFINKVAHKPRGVSQCSASSNKNMRPTGLLRLNDVSQSIQTDG